MASSTPYTFVVGGQTSVVSDSTASNAIFINCTSISGGILLEAGTNGIQVLSPSGLRVREPSGSGSNYVEVTAPVLAGNRIFTLPPDNGIVDYVLRTDGGGITTWLAPNTPFAHSAPTAVSANTVTLTIAELLTGLLTRTMSAIGTWTLPTATLVVAGLSAGAADNISFDFYIINTDTGGANDITVAAGTDGTMVGNVDVPSAATSSHTELSSAHFRLRVDSVAAPTYICYRIA